MRFFDLLKLSLRMFKARTMRTLLTILGMSVGIAAIIFLVSFGYGLQRTLLQKITTSDALVSLDVTAGKEGGPDKLDSATIDDLRLIPDVTDVIPVLELSGQGRFDGITLDINTVSSEASLLKTEGLKVMEGRLLDKDEVQSIVITTAVAQVFNTTPDKMIGRPVDLTLFRNKDTAGKESSYSPNKPYTIVGVVAGEENIVYLPLSSLSGFQIDSYTKLKAKCRSTGVMGQVRGEIEGPRTCYCLDKETIDAVCFQTPRDFFKLPVD